MRHFHTLLAAATAFSLQAQVPSYVPTNGLVGWWPFSGNANDESGTGNNGVVFGPTLALDRFGNVNQAYGFNGLSDYIEIMDDASLDLENELSISVWFNTNDYTLPQYIINKSSNGTSDSWLLDLSANPVNESEIRMLVGGLTSNLPYSDPIIFSNGQWYHVLCTYDLQFVRFYVNGALVTSFPVSTATPSNSNNVRIGAPFQPWGANPQIFNGLIDDVGMWNRALTQTEIQALFSAALAPPCISLIPVSFTGLSLSYTLADAPITLSGSPAGGVFIGPGVSGNTFDPLAAGVGTHSIQYVHVDGNNCVNAAGQCTEVTLNAGTGGNNMAANGVWVFPNPNRGQFTVEVELTGLVSMQVFDARGRQVHNEVFQANGGKTQRTLDLSGLATGSYTVQVRNAGAVVTQQVVVE